MSDNSTENRGQPQWLNVTQYIYLSAFSSGSRGCVSLQDSLGLNFEEKETQK